MHEIYRDVLFVGDEHPVINIICDLLHEGLRAELRDLLNQQKIDINIHHCTGTAHLEKNTDKLFIYTSRIPAGIKLIYNYNNKNIISNDYDDILFIQPYPFTFEGINHELEYIDKRLMNTKLNKITSYKVLFYRDINQHTGAGDLIGIDEALSGAEAKLRQRLSRDNISEYIQFMVYRKPVDLIRIFHGGFGSIMASIEICPRYFEKWRRRLDDFRGITGDYAFMLEDYENLLSEMQINQATKFSTVKGSKDIIKSYGLNYINLMKDDLMKFTEEIYTDSVNSICFWDLNSDVENLKKNVMELVKKELVSKEHNIIKCPDTEAEYNHSIRNEMHCDTKFTERASFFVNETLMEFIYSYLKKKENLLLNQYYNDENSVNERTVYAE